MHNLLFSIYDVVPEIDKSFHPASFENDLFYNLIENSNEGYTVLDKNLRVLYRNTSAGRINGWQTNSFVSEKIEDIIHPDDKVRIEAMVTEVLSLPGISKTAIFKTKHFDGHYIWIECTFSNLADKSANELLVFNFREASLENKYEKQLANSEIKFKVLVENSTDAITVIDKNKKAVYISPSFERILGYTEEEGYNLNRTQIIHPNDRPYIMAKMLEALNNPSIPIKNVVYRTKHKDGHYVVLNSTLTNLLDDPTIGGIVNNFRDITEKQKNDADLITSESKYKSLFEKNPLPMLLWKAETNKIKECNEAAVLKYGYSREEFLNLSIADLWPPGDKVVLASDIIKTIRHDGIFKIVRGHKKKNGEVIYVDITGQLVNYNGEEMILAMNNDVTESYYYSELDKLEKYLLENASKKDVDLSDILNTYLKKMETLHFGMFCSIFEKKGSNLFAMASSGLPAEYVESINGVEIGDLKGPCGVAAITKQKVVCTDIQKSKYTEGYKRIAKENGLISCWSHPVLDSNNNVLAVFACHYRFEKHPTDLEQKTIERAVSLLQVIIENKRWEQVLLQSNTRFEQATEATSDVIWEWDLESGGVYFSKNLEKLFGHNQNINSNYHAFCLANIHPDDLDRVLLQADSLKYGTILAWSAEYRLKKACGEYGTVHNRAVVNRDGNGLGLKMIGAIQDITKQKEEQQQLKLMESVVTNATDAIKITEAGAKDGSAPRILFVNEAFTKMTGYQAEEVIGQPASFLVGPKTDENEYKHCLEATAKHQAFKSTLINYKKNGETFWKDLSLTPVINGAGTCTHWIAIEHDVTERRNEEFQKNLLVEVRAIFSNTKPLNESLVDVLEILVAYGNFPLTEFWLIDEDKGEAVRSASFTKTESLIDFIRQTDDTTRFNKGQGLAGIAWETEKVQYWNYRDDIPGFIRLQKAKNAGLKRAYSIPLIYNKTVIGLLGLFMNEDEFPALGFPDNFENFSKTVGAEIKRKQVEQELKQIFDFTPDILCIANFDGYLKKVNPAMTAILEFSEAELLSRPVIDFIHPDDKERSAARLRSFIAGEPVYYAEYRYITKSGKIKWLAWTTTDTGENGVLYCSAKNITDKKELEELLKKSNQLARIGAWDVDFESGIVSWSDITREIHEVEPYFVPDFESSVLFYKEGPDREYVIKTIDSTINNGKPTDIEIQITTAKGNIKWVRVIVEAEFVNGRCLKIYGSFQDIDSRKKAEISSNKALAERNTILESIANAFFAVDKNWIVTYWNNTAEKVLMTSKDKILQRNLWAVFSDSVNSTSFNKYHEAMDTNLPVHFEDYYEELNKWFEISAYPSESGLSVYLKEITERKHSEKLLMELNANLQKQAKELASSNEELEQFAFIASHDLQEPLRMVTSFLTQLQRKYEPIIDDKGRQYIHFAVDGAKRMRQIILDLLEYSRTGRTEQSIEHVDFNKLIKEILVLFRKQLNDQQAQVIFQNLPVANTFKTPIRQVFQNLIGNSLKYHKAGEAPVIKIACTETDTQFQFSVKDNGIGIAPAYFEKIFVIFQRLHNKDHYSGTGVGLAITKKIIENMGGNIWLESEEGVGTTFYFTVLKNI